MMQVKNVFIVVGFNYNANIQLFFKLENFFWGVIDFLTHFTYIYNKVMNMETKMGRPKKDDKDKKVKYGISIDRYLFDKMKNEEVSVSKFIQKLVKEHYGEID